jgi:hypothetical protein
MQEHNQQSGKAGMRDSAAAAFGINDSLSESTQDVPPMR